MKIKYKWLKVKQGYKRDKCALNDKGECLNWADDIPTGWYKAFGEEMINDLNSILVKYDFVDKYNIIQIKEKYGELRWYDSGIPKEAGDEYYKWLNKYEDLSRKTCIKCGSKATHTTKGYMIPLCDGC